MPYCPGCQAQVATHQVVEGNHIRVMCANGHTLYMLPNPAAQ